MLKDVKSRSTMIRFALWKDRYVKAKLSLSLTASNDAYSLASIECMHSPPQCVRPEGDFFDMKPL